MNSANLIDMVNMLSREKNIDKETIFSILENAFSKVLRDHYDLQEGISSDINRRTGDVTFLLDLIVTDKKDVPPGYISIHNPLASSLQVGDHCKSHLSFDFSRTSYRLVRQYFLTALKNFDEDRKYNYFYPKINTLVSGYVTRVNHTMIFVNLGVGEGVLYKKDALPKELFRSGDQVVCLLKSVTRTPRGIQVILSRTHNNFLACLIEREILEIQEGDMEVVNIAREPGSYAKVSVRVVNSIIRDPLGCCIGVRGSRIQNIVNELRGEKVEIIIWSEDLAQYVVSSLYPAKVNKVIIYDDSSDLDVIVSESQIPIALGRGGQNVRLASRLVRCRINILTDEQDMTRKNKELSLFLDNLYACGITTKDAEVLVENGITTMESLLSFDVTNEENNIHLLSDVFKDTFQDILLHKIRRRCFFSDVQNEDAHRIVSDDQILFLLHNSFDVHTFINSNALDIANTDGSDIIGDKEDIESMILNLKKIIESSKHEETINEKH